MASGVTAMIFDAPAIASIAISGGAPGLRDAALLEPDMTVQQIDALVLSGGSAFGLDRDGRRAGLFARKRGGGFEVAGQFVRIVPGAILFDLVNGGDKEFWTRAGLIGASATRPPTRRRSISRWERMGRALARLSPISRAASARPPPSPKHGFVVGALVAVNAVGQATIGDSPSFLGGALRARWRIRRPRLARRKFDETLLALRMKGVEPRNTTIAIVATDAELTKAQAKRMAIMAQDGLSRALRPVHAAMTAMWFSRPPPDAPDAQRISTP